MSAFALALLEEEKPEPMDGAFSGAVPMVERLLSSSDAKHGALAAAAAAVAAVAAVAAAAVAAAAAERCRATADRTGAKTNY